MFTHFKLLLHLVLAFPIFINANNTDSLRALLSKKNNPVDKIKLYVNLANSFSNYDSAVFYYNEGYKFSEREKDPYGLAYVQYARLYLEAENGHYEEAIRWGEKALAACIKANDDSLAARTHYGMGYAYYTMSDYEKAAISYINSLNLAEKCGDMRTVGRAYNVLGLTFDTKKPRDTKKALEYYFKAEAIDLQVKNWRDLGFAYLRIGAVYISNNELEKAKYYLDKAMHLGDSLNDFNVQKWTIENYAAMYKQKKEYRNALMLYLKALSLSRNMGEWPGIVSSAGSAALMYKNMGDHKNALLYADIAINGCLEHKIFSHLHHGYTIKSVILEDMGDHKNALMWYRKGVNIKDSMFKVKNNENLNELERKYETNKKEKELTEKKSELLVQKADNEKKQAQRNGFILGSALLFILVAFIFRGYKQKQKDNLVISLQKREVEEKQKEIIDSISYAKRLQDAILPPQEFVNAQIKNNFIYYKPKDIVAGDFYWAEKINDLFFIAAADSTGHGVPGAIVSVVCSNALNRSVKEFHLTETGKILDKTRELVLETFEKSSKNVKDGMDISLLCLDLKTKEISWSGANNPLWYIESNELKELKSDKQPIGKTDHPKPFTTHKIEAAPNTTFYLFTDGFADQFGGPQGKKFKYKQFSDILLKNHQLPLSQQCEIIDRTFEDWKGKLEQVDDVCIVAIKI